MKIEVGKFYSTRNGKKVRIYATDSLDYYPIHGGFERSQNIWVARVWAIDGTHITGICGDLDIVSEWVEPKPKMLAFRSQASGIIYMFSGEYNTPETAFGYTRMPHLDPPEDK